MCAKQDNNRNKITARDIAFRALLAALCIVLGYLESLVSLNFIAPGVKLGLANSVALILICKGDVGGAVTVNLVRILLSALLFGSPVSLLFSLAAGAASLIFMWLFSKCKALSAVGLSIIGAIVHNITQCLVASILLGREVFLYTPLLLLAGAISGGAVGIISGIILKKLETNGKF